MATPTVRPDAPQHGPDQARGPSEAIALLAIGLVVWVWSMRWTDPATALGIAATIVAAVDVALRWWRGH